MKTEINKLLSAVARKHFMRVDDPAECSGAQMWDGQWWVPLTGCDTLSNMLDDMIYAIERQQTISGPDSTKK